MMDAENVRLGEICTIQYGFAFNSKKFTEDDSKIPLIRIRNVKRGFSNTYYDGPFSSEYLVHKGDLLVGMDGEFNIARWKSQDALLNQRVCKIVANSNVDEEYLRFYLKRALKDIENKTSFVTVKHLSAKKLSNLVIKLPKKNIQISISKQLSFLESLIHNFNEENVLFDELVKARFVEMFGDIISNDKNWNSKPLKELCDISRGASPRPISDYLGGTIPWIKIGDATIGDSIYINSTKEHIIKEGVRKSRFIKKGSLIFANCGVSLGFCRIINFDGCIHDGWLAFQNIDTSLNKIFLLTTINQMTGYFRKIAPGGTQPNLNTDIVGNYIQVVPPLELQNQFADFVKEVDKSRLEVQKSLKKTQELFDSLMQKYFG